MQIVFPATAFLPIMRLVAECLNVRDLLDCFCCQDVWRVGIDANAIFDAHAHTAEVLRPLVTIWNVNAGFDGNAVPSAQKLATAVSRAVVDVKADVVSDVMREQLAYVV